MLKWVSSAVKIILFALSCRAFLTIRIASDVFWTSLVRTHRVDKSRDGCYQLNPLLFACQGYVRAIRVQDTVLGFDSHIPRLPFPPSCVCTTCLCVGCVRVV